MTQNELQDEQVEHLLSGTTVPGHEELSVAMRRITAQYLSSTTTPVGGALSEFVDVKLAAQRGATPPEDHHDLRDPVSPDIDLSPSEDASSDRRSSTLWKKMSSSLLLGAAGVAFLTTLASAGSNLSNGDYSLILPGVGEFQFTVDSDGVDETVIAVAAPEGYAVDDDDPAKAAWKDAASLEVEVKSDKIEGDYDWSGGDAGLTLPGGGSITISEPDSDGNFTVSASGGWTAFGSGSDWIVANSDEIATATAFFKIEATDSGFEIKPVDAPGDGFLNDLEEDHDEDESDKDENESEEDKPEKDESEDGSDNNGEGNNNGNGKNSDD